MKRHSNEIEAAEAHREAFDAAVGVEGGCWMAAVWCVLPSGEIMCHRTTHKFPGERFSDAVGTLTKTLLEDVASPASMPPLPRAAFRGLPSVLRPFSRPLGDGDPAEAE